MLAQTPAVVTSRAAAVGLPIHPNVVLNSRGIRISCAALGNGAPRLEAVHPRRKSVQPNFTLAITLHNVERECRHGDTRYVSRGTHKN
jgi:hypothetical protein